ncbi:MAG: hypothetical protein UW05_C0037G0001, partial [Candidatus Giovannonibacteria bacterium GW2011_GWC2_43_8]
EKKKTFEEYINFINFDILKNIYKSIYDRARLDTTNMNFFRQEKIQNRGSLGFGKYSVRENTLGVNWFYIESQLSKDFPEVNPQMMLTYVLFHEETHALSKVDCSPDPQFGGQQLERLGYEREIPAKKGWYDDVFEAFNEGVTDNIAHEVFREYASQTGSFTDQEVDKFLAWQKKNIYSLEKHLADTFVIKLTKATGLSNDTVWDAVKSGLFTGDNLYKSELREYLDDELGAEYMERLSRGKILRTKKEPRGLIEQKTRDLKAAVLKLSRKFK